MKEEGSVFITLGSGNEFGIADYRLFIRSTRKDSQDNITAYEANADTNAFDRVIDLGPSTKENLKRLVKYMSQLECHTEK